MHSKKWLSIVFILAGILAIFVAGFASSYPFFLSLRGFYQTLGVVLLSLGISRICPVTPQKKTTAFYIAISTVLLLAMGAFLLQHIPNEKSLHWWTETAFSFGISLLFLLADKWDIKS